MEEWQKNVILKNLTNLLKNIDCNVFFVSVLSREGVISDTDEDVIKAAGKDGNMAKIKKLLDILKTRTRGFESLATALHENKQTGALFTLLEGAECHVHDKSAFQACGIEINIDEVLSKTVYFEGAKVSLKDLCCTIESNRLASIVKNCMDVATYKKLMYNNDTKKTKLVYNTVPKPISYYIPRTITLKSKLDPSIFYRLNSDVFLIEGIQLHELTVLANGSLEKFEMPSHKEEHNTFNSSQTQNNMSIEMMGPMTVDWQKTSNFKLYVQTDTSSNQLHQLTVRFILLEKETHFNKIVALSKAPVHWIKYESENYVYIKSNQNEGRSRVQDFLPQSADELFSEDDFLNMSVRGPRCHAYLLYESPGMGKTILLAEFARKVKAMSPQGNTVFISASNLVNIYEKEAKLDDMVFRNKLAKCITKSKLGMELQVELFKSTEHCIHLFVDGFDEIQKSDIEHARNIISFILNKMKNIRLYITTRPHYKVELENLFGISGYNILPFQENDQVLFFTSYWHKEHDISITDIVSNFAKNCIKTFNSTVTVEDRSLAGIPLQCKMLAELYLDDVREGTQTLQERYLINSIYKMYKRYIDSRLEMCKHKAEREALYKFHLVSAINLIFPEKLNPLCPAFTENIYRFGIMEYNTSSPSKPVFVHRSFAEFLAAEAILDWCRFKPPKEICSKTLTQFFLNDLFQTQNQFQIGPTWAKQFYHAAVTRFFEMGFIENFLNVQKLVNINKPENETGCNIEIMLLNLLKASLANDSSTLFNLFQKLLRQGEISQNNPNFLKSIMSRLFGWPDHSTNVVGISNEKLRKNYEMKFLVSISAKLCSANLVELVCDFLYEISGKHFYEFEYSRESSPVYLALQRGDYQVVEYLLKQTSPVYFSIFCPLNAILTKSYFDNVAVIEQKQQIIELLLTNYPEHFDKNAHYRLATEYIPPPLLSYESHLQLLKLLIQKGADMLAKHTENFDRNVLHLVSQYFSPESFDEFVKFIFHFDEGRAKSLFEMQDCSEFERYTIHHAVLFCELKISTIELLESHNVKLDIISDGKTFLHRAILGKRSVTFLKFIIDKGYCSLASQDCDGYTFLHCLSHLYSESDYIEILKYLIHLGRQDIFHIRNNKLALPIHVAVRCYEISEKTLNLFQIHSVDFNSTDTKGNSLLMVAVYAKKSLSTLKTLISFGVDIMAQNNKGINTAHLAASRYSAEEFHDFVEFVLSLPTDNTQPKQIFEIRDKTKHERTPIHIAVKNIELHFYTLELIHTHNLKLDIVDGEKRTILHHAIAAKRYVAFIKFLIEKRYCPLESQDCDGNTFLQYLPKFYNESEYFVILEYLLKTKRTDISHNALLRLANNKGETPLHYAVLYNKVLPKTLDLLCGKMVLTAHDEISNECCDLIDSLCDINALTRDGFSVLFYAIFGKRSLNLIKELISRGADWRYRTNNNTTSLLLSAEVGLFDHVKYFIELGLDIHEADNDGDNALHCAVLSKNGDVGEKVAFLILKGANLLHKNKKGKTPYMVAVEKGIKDESILNALQTVPSNLPS